MNRTCYDQDLQDHALIMDNSNMKKYEGSSAAEMKVEHKRKYRSAKQVERCRKYRERQSAKIQKNRMTDFDRYAPNRNTNTQALVAVPPFNVPCLYIPAATPKHQPIYYFCPGMIPPSNVSMNACLPPPKGGIVKETQENNYSANDRGRNAFLVSKKTLTQDNNMTSQGLTENFGAEDRTRPDISEIISADDIGTSQSLTEIVSTDDKRTSPSLAENLCADDNRNTAVLTNNINVDYNRTKPDLKENICADDIRTSLEITGADDNRANQEFTENRSTDNNNVRDNQNEDSTDNDNNYITGNEETGPDNPIHIANSDDNDINGIMSIFVNSSIHCVLSTVNYISHFCQK